MNILPWWIVPIFIIGLGFYVRHSMNKEEDDHCAHHPSHVHGLVAFLMFFVAAVVLIVGHFL